MCNMYQTGILVCMRTTMNLDDALVRDAMRVTGLREKTAVVHEGLRALLAREAARRLIALGGSMPKARAAPRRRSRGRRTRS